LDSEACGEGWHVGIGCIFQSNIMVIRCHLSVKYSDQSCKDSKVDRQN
jgi:hypothetical protein